MIEPWPYPLVIEVPGLPVAFARSGGHGKVRFTPKKQRSAMADLKWMASRIIMVPLECPLHVSFLFQWPFPKSKQSARARSNPLCHWRTARPDADNLIKLCFDALNGIIWIDDSIIVSCEVYKLYGDGAKTVITVRPAGAGALVW